MNNQSSPAQLLFPTVPANYCPEGRWSDIFNSFIQLYLNNGTVNIPGLGEVTPFEIATINQELLDLQNQYDALTSNVRSGTIVSPATGPRVVPITFSTPMPTANYQIYIEFVSTQTANTGTTPQTWAIVTGTKLTTGFSLRYQIAGSDDISDINWQVFSLTTT
jgi:hypothetical protein